MKEKAMQKIQKTAFNSSGDVPGLVLKTNSFVRRKSSELRKLLPNSPCKAITIVKHLWNQLYRSPRNRMLIDKMWSNDIQMGKFMYKMGKYRSRKNEKKLTETVDKMKQRYTSLRRACSKMDMQWSKFHNCTRLYKRKLEQWKFICKLCPSDVQSIKDFFVSDQTSFPMPDKKYAGKQFMKKTLEKSCKMYNLLANTTKKKAPSTFQKYKPKSVKLQGEIPFRQMYCEVCQNFEFVMNSASKYLSGIPNNIDKSVDSSLCEYSSYFPKIDCALRKCQKCGVDKVEKRLTDMNTTVLGDKHKKFLIKQWITKRAKIPGTGNFRSYLHWRHDRLSYSDLLKKYINSLENMASHSFFAVWNFHQYLVAKNNIEKGLIIVVHDYALVS